MTVGSDTNLAQEQYRREEDRVAVEQTAKGVGAIFAFVTYLSKKIEQDVTNAAQQSLEEKITDFISKEAHPESLRRIFTRLKTKAKSNLLDDSLERISVIYSDSRKLIVDMRNPYVLKYDSSASFSEPEDTENYAEVHRALVKIGYTYDKSDMLAVQDGWITKKVGDDDVMIFSENAGYSFKFSFNPSKSASLTEVARILGSNLCGHASLTDRIKLVGNIGIHGGEKPSQKSSEYFDRAVEEFNKTSDVQIKLKFEN